MGIILSLVQIRHTCQGGLLTFLNSAIQIRGRQVCEIMIWFINDHYYRLLEMTLVYEKMNGYIYLTNRIIYNQITRSCQDKEVTLI